MARAPLPGWVEAKSGVTKRRRGGVFLAAWPDGYWQARVIGPRRAHDGGEDQVAAQLAAEDAARSLVDEMAAALGGAVTWNESEGE